MTGRYNEAGAWVEDEQAASVTWPATMEPMKEPTPVQEPTTEENASMLRELVNKVIGKAVSATQLAQDVQEQAEQIRQLRMDLDQARVELNEERREHGVTRQRLGDIEAELARKETVVHDLVMERDIALGERNAAQGERDDARTSVNFWQGTSLSWEQKFNSEQEANHVLRERCERMAEHIRAFKSAYAALSEAA